MGKIQVVSVAVCGISAGLTWIAQAGSPLSSAAMADSLSSPSQTQATSLSLLASTSALLSSQGFPSAKAPGPGPAPQRATEAMAVTSETDPSPLKIGERHQLQPDGEVPPATLYRHQMDDQEVATVYLKDLPIISFVEHPDLEPPLLRASSLVAQLNQLAQGTQGGEVSLAVQEITAEGDDPQGQYVIQLNDQQLLPIDAGILLAGEKSHTTVALTATNRLRRLLFQSPPIKTPPPLPQPQIPESLDPPVLIGRAEQPQAFLLDQGYASWYGHGRYTHQLTAAHRQLPFGTQVRVTNLENGKSAVVTINDRGPFLKGRVIDLSRAAAQTLDMIRAGVVKVQIEVVDP